MNQEEAAKKNGIALICVNGYQKEKCSIPLLNGEIPGAEVYYHTLLQGDKLLLKKDKSKLRTLLLIDGEIMVDAEGGINILKERASYVADIKKGLAVSAKKSSHILEITWLLGDKGKKFIQETGVTFPMIQIYKECSQYREDFKSKKCISRSMIDHHVLPGFCMGSNESYGPDRIEKHKHPLIDQFFFSFEENDIELLIDDMVQPYDGNTLIHIPLGSDHGVNIPKGKKMHYVWIDFMIDPEAVEYLDKVHKKTGVIEYFDENNQVKV